MHSHSSHIFFKRSDANAKKHFLKNPSSPKKVLGQGFKAVMGTLCFCIKASLPFLEKSRIIPAIKSWSNFRKLQECRQELQEVLEVFEV
jgi:hypothetical protein